MDAPTIEEVLTPRLRQALAHYLGAPYEIRTLEAIAATTTEVLQPFEDTLRPDLYRLNITTHPDEEGRIGSELCIVFVKKGSENDIPTISPIYPFKESCE